MSTNLEKDVLPTPAQQQALAESQTLFLANQKRYQELNEEIASLEETAENLAAETRGVEAKLTEQRKAASGPIKQAEDKHDLKVAALKLLVLIPMVLVVGYFFFKHRSGIYAPFIYAAGIAVLWKVGWVMHDHFPTRVFKYILIVKCELKAC